MEHLVLYRKYRPKTFSEIVGQEHIVRTLTNALLLNRLAHAYLFTGPRGTGKTTIARLLAKAVNCEKKQRHPEPAGAGEGSRGKPRDSSASPQNNYEPCNQCPACQEINQGNSLDLIEIDAASNRGIDEIRELKEGIKFSPSRLKYKVFIIDETHMLTPPAFNALLKTLEEPPAHAIFILATTEAHKVPQTIISRCQRFDFHKLPLEKIVGRLAFIAGKEKIKIGRPALELIALNADGCVRDGESLLGQIMSMEDKEITLEEVQTILGVTDIKAIGDLAGFLAEKNSAKAISHINQLVADGYDLVQFSKSLVNYLRKMMLLKVDANLAGLVASELTKEQLGDIIKKGERFSANDLAKLIHLFVQAGIETKSSDFPQLPLELAVVEWCG